jgi:hypothetical protein
MSDLLSEVPEADRTWDNCGRRDRYCDDLRKTCPCEWWAEKKAQRMARLEAALAVVTKERDEAVGHLRNALFGPGEPPPCDCDEDVMHEHILQWNRLSDRARDWLVARDAEKEGM